jgi:formylglycine-generating enzyme required for sulfatase activity
MKNLQSSLVFTVLLSMSYCVSAHEVKPEVKNKQTIRNSLGMNLVRIPAGEFMMGSEESIKTLQADFPLMSQKRLDELRDEAPLHKVRITRDFYMTNTEVTVGQFRQFLQESGYQVESVRDGTGGYGYNPEYDPEKSVKGDQFEGRDVRYRWDSPGFPQTDQHPVVNVTLNDARALATWLSQKEGRQYRIPTEAEWEYSARAGTRTRFHSGDQPESLIGVANTFDQVAKPYWPKLAAHALQGKDGFAFTAPVASFTPNAFGLYDMHGNAWEWTNDFYAEDYYARSPVDDPQGPSEGNVVVRRGGSWHTWALYARSSYRNWNTPETRYTLVGIRLVMNAPASVNK